MIIHKTIQDEKQTSLNQFTRRQWRQFRRIQQYVIIWFSWGWKGWSTQYIITKSTCPYRVARVISVSEERKGGARGEVFLINLSVFLGMPFDYKKAEVKQAQGLIRVGFSLFFDHQLSLTLKHSHQLWTSSTFRWEFQKFVYWLLLTLMDSPGCPKLNEALTKFRYCHIVLT